MKTAENLQECDKSIRENPIIVQTCLKRLRCTTKTSGKDHRLSLLTVPCCLDLHLGHNQASSSPSYKPNNGI